MRNGGVNPPRGETIWVTYHNTKGEPRFIVTSKANRDYYFLYELVQSQIKKLGKARCPLEFEEKYGIAQKLGK